MGAFNVSEPFGKHGVLVYDQFYTKVSYNLNLYRGQPITLYNLDLFFFLRTIGPKPTWKC